MNDFNLYGRTYRVTAQAEGAARTTPEAVNQIYVRSDEGAMVPLSTLVRISELRAPPFIEHYNVFRSADDRGTGQRGLQRRAGLRGDGAGRVTLPPGYGYEWTGTTYQQKQTEGAAPVVFGMALAFVFLVLAGLYESWAVPFAVLLAIPFAVFGAFGGLALRAWRTTSSRRSAW